MGNCKRVFDHFLLLHQSSPHPVSVRTGCSPVTAILIFGGRDLLWLCRAPPPVPPSSLGKITPHPSSPRCLVWPTVCKHTDLNTYKKQYEQTGLIILNSNHQHPSQPRRKHIAPHSLSKQPLRLRISHSNQHASIFSKKQQSTRLVLSRSNQHASLSPTATITTVLSFTATSRIIPSKKQLSTSLVLSHSNHHASSSPTATITA